jgi:hypothetical protein
MKRVEQSKSDEISYNSLIIEMTVMLTATVAMKVTRMMPKKRLHLTYPAMRDLR